MSEYIGKRYMIIKTIGKGGMADVYLALDTILNREVAVKVLKGELSSDPVALERFRREAHASTCLSHPNIVDIYDVGEDKGRHYIVMEYIKGYTLKQLIQKRGALPYKEAVWLMKQLSSALMEAHKNGIIHRDIKSQNVLIKADGTIKMVDFGIALAHDAMQITSKDSILGSVHYLAPELTKGGVANMQSDIYSLGIVFFEMLTGDLPFKGEQAVQIALKHIKDSVPSVRMYREEIPQSVDNIVLRATAKSLDERYENIAQMIKDLNHCLKPEHLNDPKITLRKVNDEAFLSKAQVAISGEAKKKKKKKNTKVFSVAFLTTISLISIALILIILFLSGVIGIGDKYIPVPDLKGLSIVEAGDLLDEKGLSIDLSDIERVMTDDVEEGKIISYSPSDTEVEKGTKIHVVVSSGMYAVMDDYVGRDINVVESFLKDHKFTVSKKAVESDKKPGSILSQEGLLSGDKYNPNTLNSVSFTYSAYPSFVLEIGSIKGRDVNVVKSELEAKGAKVELKVIAEENLTQLEKEKYEPGTVVRIDPSEGSTYIQEGDRKITISYYQ